MIRHLAMLPLDTDGVAVAGSDGRKLGADVLAVLRRHVQADGALEAGGLLLGRYIVDSQAVVADEATEPAAGDVREPRAFHRLDHSHVVRTQAAWSESGGRVHYCGEWHTHSEPVPVPSSIDFEAWERTYGDVVAQHGRGTGPILGVIVGQTHIGVWEVGE